VDGGIIEGDKRMKEKKRLGKDAFRGETVCVGCPSTGSGLDQERPKKRGGNGKERGNNVEGIDGNNKVHEKRKDKTINKGSSVGRLDIALGGGSDKLERKEREGLKKKKPSP